MQITSKVVSDKQLAGLMAHEAELFKSRTPKSAAIFASAQEALLNGVPMPWMSDWGTPYPMYVASAVGNRITDVDGNTLVVNGIYLYTT